MATPTRTTTAIDWRRVALLGIGTLLGFLAAHDDGANLVAGAVAGGLVALIVWRRM